MKRREHLNLFVVCIIGMGVYSFLLFTLVDVESHFDGANINNMTDALWYSVVTLTTVGYGDFYPISPIGRVIGYLFVIASLGVLGYLIGKINSLISSYRDAKRLGYKGTTFTNHIVIIGWNKFSSIITQELVNANINVAIITDDINDLELIKEKYDKKLVYVLLSDIIEKANIKESSAVFINIEDDMEKLVYYLNASKYFPSSLNYIVLAQDIELKKVFVDAGIPCVLSIDEFASKIVASYIFEPDVAEYVEDLLASAVSDNDYDMIEYRVTKDNPYLDQDYNSVFFSIKEDYDALLIGLVKVDECGKRKLLKNPNDKELKICLDDFVIVIANGAVSDELTKSFNVTEGTVIY